MYEPWTWTKVGGRGGDAGGMGGAGQRRIKGRKKWDNCNSIILKYNLKNWWWHWDLILWPRIKAMITSLPWVENKPNLYISNLTKHSLRVVSHTEDFSTRFCIVIHTNLFKSLQLTKVKRKQNLRKYIFEKHYKGVSLSNDCTDLHVLTRK